MGEQTSSEVSMHVQSIEGRDVIVSIRDLKKSYFVPGGEVQALRGVDLEIIRGEMVALVGASGAGKSTLLHLIGALDRPSSGGVFFRGERIHSRPDAELAQFRNRCLGFVFQFHHLLPEFTALENVIIPGLLGSKSRRETEIKARDLIEKVGLGTRANHRPAELSGGEQQRVAVARALVNDPPIVLADEPTGNLDSRASGSIVNLLREFNGNRNLTILVVTHNPSISAQMDRIVTMRDGRITGKL